MAPGSFFVTARIGEALFLKGETAAALAQIAQVQESVVGGI